MGRYSGQQEFKRYLPSDGLHQAVFVDYELLPNQDTKWGIKNQIRYFFLLDEHGDDGKPIVITKKFTDALYVPKPGRNAPAQFTFLNSWRGRPMTKQDIENFDQEQLIGVNAMLMTEVKTFDDGTEWADILSIKPVKKDSTQLDIPKEFVRKKDRQSAEHREVEANELKDLADAAFGPAGPGGIGEEDKEDLPF